MVPTYRVFRVGAIVLLLAIIITCICSLVLSNVSQHSTVISYGANLMVYIMGFIEYLSCTVSAVQLGLDQMPDASSANITSYVTWLVFSAAFGIWLVQARKVLFNCIAMLSWSLQAFNLIPIMLMPIVCCCLFSLGPKWLIIEPNP